VDCSDDRLESSPITRPTQYLRYHPPKNGRSTIAIISVTLHTDVPRRKKKQRRPLESVHRMALLSSIRIFCSPSGISISTNRYSVVVPTSQQKHRTGDSIIRSHHIFTKPSCSYLFHNTRNPRVENISAAFYLPSINFVFICYSIRSFTTAHYDKNTQQN